MVGRVQRTVIATGLVLGLIGCTEEEATDDASEQSLSAAELLTRASLDLRGVRPSVEELEKVEGNPEEVDSMIAEFVDDPAFGGRVKDMFAGGWRTRVDFYQFDGDDYDELELNHFYGAIGEEPLNLIAYVAINDLPYTEVVHSDETFVDPALLGLWPLEEVSGDGEVPQGTVRARYTDERPLHGVLTHNAFYWRHSSTIENANRGRANAMSQALLCQSYLDRPIDFPNDLDLTDSESIRNAIENNGACQGCHSTMDPLASYMWGFMYPDTDTPLATYEPGQERAWQIYTDAEPAFFGKSGERITDLADHVADDERFISCAVRTVYEGMLGRPAALADEGALAVHREAFLDGDLTIKSLVRSILQDPSYRGETWEPRFGGDPTPMAQKVAPAGVLASSLTDLSGYSLTLGGREAVDIDLALRRLAGGSDRGDTTNVSTGAVLVQRRLAEAGAIHAVDTIADGGQVDGSLDDFLQGVNLHEAPAPEELVELVKVTRSRSLADDDPEIEALGQVWADVEAISTAKEAWVAVVTASLADPDHLIY